jgi:aconitate hydratase
MGVLPLQFTEGQNRESLCLTGEERFRLTGVRQALTSAEGHVKVTATRPDGKEIEFTAKARIDTPQEAEYYRSGGILPYVFRQILASANATA